MEVFVHFSNVRIICLDEILQIAGLNKRMSSL